MMAASQMYYRSKPGSNAATRGDTDTSDHDKSSSPSDSLASDSSTSSNHGAALTATPLLAISKGEKDHPPVSICGLIRNRRTNLTLWTAALLLSAGLLLWGPRAVTLGGLSQAQLQPPSEHKDTLVLYIFSFTDDQFLKNLEYFVREAVREDDRCEYLFVLQYGDELPTAKLPQLPSNAKYINHPNSCYDWGTFGWLLLKSGVVDWTRFKYFIFLNSSVRGPFLPVYLRENGFHWSQAFIGLLSDTVKLVGPTISCAGTPFKADVTKEWRRNPHVQSYAVATDRVGLEVLIRTGEVFTCHDDRMDTIWYSELGSALAILKAGYNLASFLVRYAGVDWRQESTWQCNAGWSSAGVEDLYDGITADPMEVMFVKLKQQHLRERASFATRASKYDAWLQDAEAQGLRNVSGNEYQSHEVRLKLPRMLERQVQGSTCFDHKFYLQANPDLVAVLPDKAAAWEHFVRYGQFEDRQHSFTCPFSVDLVKP